ncbi:MAG: hypothetical protein IIA49_08995 [Bacteroidetes bacterium]|nr:hypothetical protein [Bacteroidota bacterium]
MSKKKFDKELQKSLKWLATEHNYFLELKKDLDKLKEDIKKAKEKDEVKDIKAAFKDFRYIAKSEKRFNRHEHTVEEILHEMKSRISLSGTIKEIEELIQRLHIEAANLISVSSLYEGAIKVHLTNLRDEIKEHKIEKAKQILIELGQLIEETEKFIAALSIDLNKAKKLFHNLALSDSPMRYAIEGKSQRTKSRPSKIKQEKTIGDIQFKFRSSRSGRPIMDYTIGPPKTGEYGNTYTIGGRMASPRARILEYLLDHIGEEISRKKLNKLSGTASTTPINTLMNEFNNSEYFKLKIQNADPLTYKLVQIKSIENNS